jgi:subtilisin family serine protease
MGMKKQMQKFAIVRGRRVSKTRDPFTGGFVAARGAVAADPPEMNVDVDELTPANVSSLGQDPSVAAIARVMPTKLIKPFEVTQSALDDAWGIAAVGATSSSCNGAGVTVCILDTGIDAMHLAFQGIQIVQRDFSGSGNGDVQGHGTHCGGTIFGRAVNGKRIGVAPGVTHVRVGKVLGDDGGGSSIALFQGIQWALDEGAKVISMSLGFDFPGLVQQLHEEDGLPVDVATSIALEAYRANLRAFDTLMDFVRARTPFYGGTVVVAASGNESRRPEFEISVSVPAAANDVVAVGALERVSAQASSLGVALFSNTLPTLSAPGVQILSAKAGGGLRELSGTSMATPHVAGVAALWWQALASQPAATAEGVRARLRATARTNVFTPNTDPADRGEGIVSSPL